MFTIGRYEMYFKNKQSALEMVHNGEGSFFLSSQLDIDLPSDMMSSIISNRKKAEIVKILQLILKVIKMKEKLTMQFLNTSLQDKVLKHLINDNTTYQ